MVPVCGLDVEKQGKHEDSEVVSIQGMTDFFLIENKTESVSQRNLKEYESKPSGWG